MVDFSWPSAFAGFLSGGAFGTVIKIFYDRHQSRTQPVGRRVDLEPVFVGSGEKSDLSAKVTLEHDGQPTEVHNLYIATVAVENRGIHHFGDLEFGVKLPDGTSCVFIAHRDPDQHHRATILTPVHPHAPLDTIRINLCPFHRGNKYTFKMYLVLQEGASTIGTPEFSSDKPVRFVDMPTVAESLAQALEGSVIKLGPIYLSARR